jgi:hypothetical protein
MVVLNIVRYYWIQVDRETMMVGAMVPLGRWMRLTVVVGA